VDKCRTEDITVYQQQELTVLLASWYS